MEKKKLTAANGRPIADIKIRKPQVNAGLSCYKIPGSLRSLPILIVK